MLRPARSRKIAVSLSAVLLGAVVLLGISGCAPGPYWTTAGGAPATVLYDNPALVPLDDHRMAFDQVVDVVDDYFEIDREEPVRRIGNTLTEGRIDTFPRVGATLLEPWREDSANAYERLESTLQSIRRYAVVRVTPGEGGYWVAVNVYKELEDVARPEHATAGAASFRYDDSLTRVVNPVVGQEIHEGWIRQGRDTALEQRILADLHGRAGRAPAWPAPP